MATAHFFTPDNLRNTIAALSALVATHTTTSAFEPQEDGIYAVFDTSMGEFTAKLAYDGVPLTTANFIGLAEGKIPRFDPDTGDPVEVGPFYDGLIFHRVIDGFVIQSGDPDPESNAIGGPGYAIPDEMHPNLNHTIPYVISMANGYRGDLEQSGQYWGIGENTGGSQFFITIEPPANQPGPGSLDGHHSVFGVIEDGTDVLEAIGDVPVDSSTLRPLTDVTLNSVTIIRKGEEANAWNIRDFELPYPTDASSSVNLQKTESGSALQFPATSGEDFIVRESNDLSSWTSDILTSPDSEPSTLSLPLGDDQHTFVQLESINSPAEYQERIPGKIFVVDMANHPLSSEPWTFTFNDNLDDFDREDGFGTVTIEGLPDATILAYEYHRLPSGARMRVQTQSFQIMTFYFRFTTESAGGFLVWVDSYLHGTSANDPLRFPTTGTFQVTEP